MPILGISHITLVVQDLERTSSLIMAVFDAQEVYSSGDKIFSISRERFFLIAGIWVVIMEGTPLTKRSYNHIAFEVTKHDIEFYRKRLEEAGVEVHIGRPRIEGEGVSLYFYDYDNHLFELHAGTLEGRLRAYAKHD